MHIILFKWAESIKQICIYLHWKFHWYSNHSGSQNKKWTKYWDYGKHTCNATALKWPFIIEIEIALLGLIIDRLTWLLNFLMWVSKLFPTIPSIFSYAWFEICVHIPTSCQLWLRLVFGSNASTNPRPVTLGLLYYRYLLLLLIMVDLDDRKRVTMLYRPTRSFQYNHGVKLN